MENRSPSHAAVAVVSTMYVLGGIVLGARGSSTSASILKYDSTQGAWNAVERMPKARRMHAACAIGSDIYVFGGRRELSGGKKSVLKFDTETNIWSTLEPMPLTCYNHSASVVDGDQVYIVRAGDDGKSVLRFDMASGVWSRLGATTNNKQGRATFVLGGCLISSWQADVNIRR
jgi:N-acetylneuraminic acid mutarotase